MVVNLYAATEYDQFAKDSEHLDLLVTVPIAVSADDENSLTGGTLRSRFGQITTPAFRFGRSAFHRMQAHGGAIVLISGTSGTRGDPCKPCDSVAFSATIGVAQLFASEGRPYGIRAFSVCPDWPEVDVHGALTPRAVAEIVAWLSTPAAASISGTTIVADAARTTAIGQPTTRSTEDRGTRQGLR